MDDQIMTIQNVHCYLDDSGTAWLNAEDVARGLGFTQTKNGVEYVKWERVNGYLRDFGFSPQVVKNSFIPENIFYRLAMKASNVAAEKFQALVADDILPSIRKHGAYLTVQAAEQILTNPDFIIKLAEQVKQAEMERDQFKALADARQETINEMQPKVDYCDQILQSSEALTATFIAKDYGMAVVKFNQLLHQLKIQYKDGDKRWVLYQPYAGLGYMTSQSTPVKGGFSITHNYWTQKGRMFLYNTLKKAGIVPVCERGELSDAERASCDAAGLVRDARTHHEAVPCGARRGVGGVDARQSGRVGVADAKAVEDLRIEVGFHLVEEADRLVVFLPVVAGAGHRVLELIECREVGRLQVEERELNLDGTGLGAVSRPDCRVERILADLPRKRDDGVASEHLDARVVQALLFALRNGRERPFELICHFRSSG